MHIVFVITWFCGLFYVVRLFVYNTEANTQIEPNKSILQNQFNIMIKRLWFIITWPSAILTLISGVGLICIIGLQPWLVVKICFVILLFLYHLSLQYIYLKQKNKIFKFSSMQLRIWNEVPTLLMFIIIFLAIYKNSLNGIIMSLSILFLIVIIGNAILLYTKHRNKNKKI